MVVMPASVTGAEADETEEGLIKMNQDGTLLLRYEGQEEPDQLTYTIDGETLSMGDDTVTLIGPCEWDGTTLTMTVSEVAFPEIEPEPETEPEAEPETEPETKPETEPVDLNAGTLHLYADSEGTIEIATIEEADTDHTVYSAEDGSPVIVANFVMDDTEMRACEVSTSKMPDSDSDALFVNWLGFEMYFGYSEQVEDDFVLTGETAYGNQDLTSRLSGDYTLHFTDGSPDDTANFDEEYFAANFA